MPSAMTQHKLCEFQVVFHRLHMHACIHPKARLYATFHDNYNRSGKSVLILRLSFLINIKASVSALYQHKSFRSSVSHTNFNVQTHTQNYSHTMANRMGHFLPEHHHQRPNYTARGFACLHSVTQRREHYFSMRLFCELFVRAYVFSSLCINIYIDG